MNAMRKMISLDIVRSMRRWMDTESLSQARHCTGPGLDGEPERGPNLELVELKADPDAGGFYSSAHLCNVFNFFYSPMKMHFYL